MFVLLDDSPPGCFDPRITYRRSSGYVLDTRGFANETQVNHMHQCGAGCPGRAIHSISCAGLGNLWWNPEFSILVQSLINWSDRY